MMLLKGVKMKNIRYNFIISDEHARRLRVICHTLLSNKTKAFEYMIDMVYNELVKK